MKTEDELADEHKYRGPHLGHTSDEAYNKRKKRAYLKFLISRAKKQELELRKHRISAIHRQLVLKLRKHRKRKRELELRKKRRNS